MWDDEITWEDHKLLASLRYTLLFLRHTGLMFCLLGLAVAGMYFVWSDALANEAYKIKPGRLTEGETLQGLEADVSAELVRLNKIIEGHSIFEPGILQDLREAYNASPWIMKTYAFRRDLPCAIRVEYELRQPAALAYCNGFYHEIDEEGVLLPRKAVKKTIDNLPVISGNLSNIPAHGKQWLNPGLLDALGVIKTISESPIADKIQIRQAVIRRGSFFDRKLYRRNTQPRIELYTNSGTHIKWGTYNRDDNQEDLQNDEKIAMLERVLEQAGEFRNGLTLDIRTRTISCSGGSAMR